jgi:hypothetical protein
MSLRSVLRAQAEKSRSVYYQEAVALERTVHPERAPGRTKNLARGFPSTTLHAAVEKK